jgi:hypothetical protein
MVGEESFVVHHIIVRGRQVSVLLYLIFNEAFVREGDLNECPI